MPREELVISSKAGYYMWPGPYGEWGSRKYLLASLDQSLTRMGLDYVDIFCHRRPAGNDEVIEAGFRQAAPNTPEESPSSLRSTGVS